MLSPLSRLRRKVRKLGRLSNIGLSVTRDMSEEYLNFFLIRFVWNFKMFETPVPESGI